MINCRAVTVTRASSSAIIPDDEMPTDSEGQPYEVLLNPLGIISRTNPAQIVEAALGKIAEALGSRTR